MRSSGNQVTRTARGHRAKLEADALDAAQERLNSLRLVAWDIEPISELDYIQRALAFSDWDGANEEELQQHELALLIGCRALNDNFEDITPLPHEKLSATFTRRNWSNPKMAHRMLRDCLGKIVTAYNRHAGRTRQQRKLLLERFGVGVKIGNDRKMDTVALLSAAGNAREGQFCMLFPFDMPTAVVKAVQLLADTTRPFGQHLAQCQLEGCGGFFLRKPNRKGGKPAKYHDRCRRKLRAKSRHVRRRHQEIDR